MRSRLSQAYFDEIVAENAEVFDLNTEQALQDTIEQLSSQALDHLCLSSPTTKVGRQEREERAAFLAALAALRDALDESDSWMDRLELVQHRVLSDNRMYSRLFQLEHGWSVLCRLLQVLENHTSRHRVYSSMLVLLKDRSQWADFQDSWTPPAMAAVLTDYELHTEDDQRVQSLLQLAYCSAKNCETHKKNWMKAVSAGGATIVDLCLATLDRVEPDSELASALGRWISVLCTFDDFRGAALTVSSAHENVKAWAERQTVRRLFRLLRFGRNAEIVSALRALAIDDGIVQSMVAVGVVGRTRELLQESLQEERSDLAAACLGLFRNLSANDEIKSRLCTSNKSIVALVVGAMSQYRTVPAVCEHGCGLFAAMALRQAKNAQYLMQQGAHVEVLAAMQAHPTRAVLQRQGALALRNLASRCVELRPVLLEAGAKEALLVAARHAACQDEVYAAMRDLGVEVNMVEIATDDAGVARVEKTRQTFGAGSNANFRPVF